MEGGCLGGEGACWCTDGKHEGRVVGVCALVPGASLALGPGTRVSRGLDCAYDDAQHIHMCVWATHEPWHMVRTSGVAEGPKGEGPQRSLWHVLGGWLLPKGTRSHCARKHATYCLSRVCGPPACARTHARSLLPVRRVCGRPVVQQDLGDLLAFMMDSQEAAAGGHAPQQGCHMPQQGVCQGDAQGARDRQQDAALQGREDEQQQRQQAGVRLAGEMEEEDKTQEDPGPGCHVSWGSGAGEHWLWCRQALALAQASIGSGADEH